jgi:hypothetical protein
MKMRTEIMKIANGMMDKDRSKSHAGSVYSKKVK